MSVQEQNSPPAPEPEAATPPEIEAGGVLTIDLAAIQTNWDRLGKKAMPVECAAVVKADAYGCGLEPVGKALSHAGCKTFFVADLAEARRLRAVTKDTAIYVLDGAPPGSGPIFADIDARPVIGRLLELTEW